MLLVKQSTTMTSFDNFFPSCVRAFTSDSAIDFTLQQYPNQLAVNQQAYLKNQIGEASFVFYSAKQVHGNRVINLESAQFDNSVIEEADAVMTALDNVAVAVRTADCVPIFIYDTRRHVCAVVHAGWKGTQLKIGPQTIYMMQDSYGSKAADLTVVLGPCIRDCCYEVSDEFKNIFPDCVSVKGNRCCFNMAKENTAQLLLSGVAPGRIHDSHICTCCDTRYFSFRRQKEAAGRMVSVIIMKK